MKLTPSCSRTLRRYSAIDLIDLWSGATPYRTRPYGVGSRSSTSTRIETGGSRAAACLIRASAVYRPAGPDPITATWRVCIPLDSALSGPPLVAGLQHSPISARPHLDPGHLDQ